MQIAFHLGAYGTDEDRLVRGLLKNKGKLAAEGIVVPGPGRYRAILRETALALGGAPAGAEAQSVMLDAMMDEDEALRLVLSNEQFLGSADHAVGAGQFYPGAARRIAALCNLFPDSPRELFLAIRNPATFVPALLARNPAIAYGGLMAGTALDQLCWSDLIGRIRAAVPDCPLTVWCNEDTPLIWPEVIAALTRHDPATPISGLYEPVAEIMSAEGMKWMQAYLDDHKPQTPQQRRRIVSAFLTKFNLADKIEMELDLPGWTNELVEELTDNYEEDILDIEKMPGINFIAI